MMEIRWVDKHILFSLLFEYTIRPIAQNGTPIGIETISQKIDNENLNKETAETENMIEIFRTPLLCIRMLVLCIAW